MRSTTSHAAKSGVGEHTARESEAPNVCDGKECVAQMFSIVGGDTNWSSVSILIGL
jgi:hypothetical protein